MLTLKMEYEIRKEIQRRVALADPRIIECMQEIDELRKDKARLDWLEAEFPDKIDHIIFTSKWKIRFFDQIQTASGQTFREAIDAAMQKGGNIEKTKDNNHFADQLKAALKGWR